MFNDIEVRMAPNEVLINIGLSIFGAFFALLLSNLGSPILKIEIKPKKEAFFGETEKFISLNLLLKNNPLKIARFFLVQRETAYSCHGHITFYDQSGKVLIEQMPIRWAGNPQPIKYELRGDQIVTLPEPSLIKSSGYIDIPADEQEEMDVAVRFIGEKEAYGWNSYSHFRRGRNNEYILPCGEYLIQVKLTSSNASVTEKFILLNPNDINSFQLSRLPKNILLKKIFKKRGTR